jgi:hypothetical protein
MNDKHDQIEFEEPKYSSCDCCGARTTNLVRFVTRDGAAFAVYKGAFSDAPKHDSVSLIASFGEWGEDALPSRRTAFACRLWNDGSNYNVTLVDPDDSFWAGTEFLGRILTRTEALDHPMSQEFFDLTDHVMACDQQIVEFLERTTSKSDGS